MCPCSTATWSQTAAGSFLFFLWGVRFQKGCITHQPVACRDPFDELDHVVDILNLLEVLRHEVEPVRYAPKAMNIDPNPLVEVVFLFTNFIISLAIPEFWPIILVAPSVVIETGLEKSQFFSSNFSKINFANCFPVVSETLSLSLSRRTGPLVKFGPQSQTAQHRT